MMPKSILDMLSAATGSEMPRDQPQVRAKQIFNLGAICSAPEVFHDSPVGVLSWPRARNRVTILGRTQVAELQIDATSRYI